MDHQELVKKYSEFINFPIHLWASKEIDIEVPADETDEEACMKSLNLVLVPLFLDLIRLMNSKLSHCDHAM